MEIPNLPTDNLYKFMALSGLLIVLFFTSLYVVKESQLTDDTNKITSEIGELIFEKNLLLEKDSMLHIEILDLESKLKRYKHDSTNLEIDLSDISKLTQDPNKREALKFFYTYESDILPEKKILDDIQLRIKLRDENKNLIRMKANTVILKNNQNIVDWKSLKRLRWMMLFGVLLGSYLASNGFILWYQRVQKYLDKKIKIESEKA
jgi:hypothetical protein